MELINEWYNLKDIEKINKVYDKITVKAFWDWWSDGKEAFMEIRVKQDFKQIKSFAYKYKFPYSLSGVYVKSPEELTVVINYFKDTHTIWFGINPKKQIVNSKGWKTFSGKDDGIKQIKFLFIDIDRVKKDGRASAEDLQNSDFLANQIKTELNKNNFCKSFCKICSANGVQLLIKLDIPIDIPPMILGSEGKYISNPLLENMKKIIKDGIGKILCKFSEKIGKTINAEIDDSGFNIGRVGALPGSYNFKHDSKVARGVVEISDESPNTGFTEYLKNIHNSKTQKHLVQQQYNDKSVETMLKEYAVDIQNAKKNIVINLLLTHDFPDGGINNTLWYALKILLHNQGVSRDNPYYHKIHSVLKQKHDRSFTDNGLESSFMNNFNGVFKQNHIDMVPTIVNKYLRCHDITRSSDGKVLRHPPLFEVSPKGKEKNSIQIKIGSELVKYDKTFDYVLTDDSMDFLNDVKKLGKELLYKALNISQQDTISQIFYMNEEKQIVINFLHAFRIKWGDLITVYMMKNYLDDFINYKRW